MSQEISTELTNRKTVREICKTFVLDEETLGKIKDLFQNEMNMELCKASHHKAAVKCLVIYVQSLPTCCETGKFLALDLSGISFRILCLHLKQQENLITDSEVYEITENLLHGPGNDLFDYIAECLAKFLQTIEVTDGEKLQLGVTLSFPFRQNDIDKGILVAWAKGFDCPGVVGKDVVEMLRQAIDRKRITNVLITALLNDSTGTLISYAWDNPYCKIGLNLETGVNCSYLEKIKNINTFKPDPNNRLSTMIIYCECGEFGDNGTLEFIRTKYDIELDDASQTRQCKLFEKMVAGTYLGELARKVMLECCQAGALFNGQESEQLATENTFKLSHLSKVGEDIPGSFDTVKTVLEEIGYKNPTAGDCENVHFVCNCVSRRSARLLSVILSCLINRIGDPFMTVGIEGCIFQKHPYYHHMLKEETKLLVRPEYKFDSALADDGSGRGAAMVAAVTFSSKKKEFGKAKNRKSSQ